MNVNIQYMTWKKNNSNEYKYTKNIINKCLEK